MAHDAPKGTPNLDSRLVWVIGIVAVILFFTIIVAIQAGFSYAWKLEVERKVYARPDPWLVEVEQQNTAKIKEYRWVEPGSVAAVPIEDAKRLYVQQQAAKTR